MWRELTLARVAAYVVDERPQGLIIKILLLKLHLLFEFSVEQLLELLLGLAKYIVLNILHEHVTIKATSLIFSGLVPLVIVAARST